jgi:hypothetical protein
MKNLVLAIITATALLASAAAQNQHDHSKSPDMKDCPMMQAGDQQKTGAMDADKCPMHAEHMKAGDAAAHQHGDDYAAMNSRGNEGMGFDQAKTTHHFLINKDGGIIDVQANSADDQRSVAAVRQHFQHIAHAFASGDFSIPMFVHDQAPPGVATMQKLKGAIQYRYEQTAAGARVVISSKNAEAIAAIHDFLDFQITEHRTGDPLSKTN